MQARRRGSRRRRSRWLEIALGGFGGAELQEPRAVEKALAQPSLEDHGGSAASQPVLPRHPARSHRRRQHEHPAPARRVLGLERRLEVKVAVFIRPSLHRHLRITPAAAPQQHHRACKLHSVYRTANGVVTRKRPRESKPRTGAPSTALS